MDANTRELKVEAAPALPSLWVRRMRRFLYKLERIIEAMFGSRVKWTGSYRPPEGGITLYYRLRWWNPATWIGWCRVRFLGDRHGSTYYIPDPDDDPKPPVSLA